MKRCIRWLGPTLVLLCAGSLPLFAADAPSKEPSQYGLGDQTMSIDAGMFIPLFLLPTGTTLLAGSPPHLTLGGVGGLTWAAYVAPQIRLGIEVEGEYFSQSPNANPLLMLPFIARGSWVFSAYPFEIPLTFGLGMNIVKYVDMTTIDLLLRPGVSGLWIYNSSWSFGVNLNWWFDMQFAPTAADSRIGNFLEVSLTALYHF